MTEAAILSSIAALLAEVARVREDLDMVLDYLPVPETLTTSDIAARRGSSVGWLTLESAPWRLPGFGKADEGEGRRRWRRETVRRWYSEANWEEIRRAEWEALTPAERRALQAGGEE